MEPIFAFTQNPLCQKHWLCQLRKIKPLIGASTFNQDSRNAKGIIMK
jgi:hypothetical protein